MFLIQSPNRSETSYSHFETSARKVKPPLKKVKPILFLSETSRFHRCFSASVSFGAREGYGIFLFFRYNGLEEQP